tara:strand:- start:195 stop:632 length:438 start_codon:yes stop_codon:yes gene_type:complete
MRDHDHREFSPQLMGLINRLQESRQGRQGWCYAALNDEGTLLKLGGTKNCPICRIHGNQKVPGIKKKVRMNLVALAWSEDWKIHEQHLLRIATPIYGDEWFDPGPHFKCQKSLLDYLCSEGMLVDPWDATMKFMQSVEEQCLATT